MSQCVGKSANQQNSFKKYPWQFLDAENVVKMHAYWLENKVYGNFDLLFIFNYFTMKQ